MTHASPIRVLVVEDDAMVSQSIQTQLHRLSFRVAGAAYNAEEGVSLAAELRPDVVLMDMRMPDPDTGAEDPSAGLKAIRGIQQEAPAAVVLLTAFESPDLVRQAGEAGIGAYLVKPVKDNDLDRAIHVALARFEDLRHLTRLNHDLQETNQALARREELFRTISESTSVGIFMADLQGRMTYLSPAWTRITGCPLEELMGFRLQRLIHPDDLESLQHDFLQDPGRADSWTGTIRIQARHGSLRWLRVHGAPLRSHGTLNGCVGVVDDITDRRRARELREQAQKRESLTVLAGGIAHDFNNLLTAIQGYLELAVFQAPDDSPLNRYLFGIQQAVARASDLSRQMLTFAGQTAITLEPLDLNRLIEALKPTLVGVLPPGARLRLDLAQEISTIQGDPVQIQQVIHSLVMNAGEALPNGEGQITLATSQSDCHPAETSQGDPWVTLSVQDTGCGMDTETLARIFDPFFSTKFMGRGLGLPATQGIIRAHQGSLEVESQPGKGTTFTLHFPAAPVSVEAPPPAAAPLPSPRGRVGRILLVDDEDALRESVSEFLELLGYEVVQAVDGLEAVAKFQAHAPEIGLIIMDLTMPRMDGHEAFQAIRALDPGVKVILSSGYSEQEATRQFVGAGLAAFLQKPYTLRDMETLISRTLTPAR